MMMSTN